MHLDYHPDFKNNKISSNTCTVSILLFNMILNHNLNPDLKWNANERFQFLKIGENGLGRFIGFSHR